MKKYEKPMFNNEIFETVDVILSSSGVLPNEDYLDIGDGLIENV